MQYRKFGNMFDVSALGFGAMRLPALSGAVDEAEAIRMMRYALDHGVNYIDTAYVYHDGQSEVVVGKALLDGYRRNVHLATKYPMFGDIPGPDDVDAKLNEQLKRLQTDYVDCYLFHCVNRKNFENTMMKHNLIERMEKIQKAGKIKHFGFSFHDDADTFIKIVDAYPWEFCQVQYNYMDTQNQAGVKGIEYAASKGIAVIVMEPVLGGKLANPPRPVRDIMDADPEKRSPVEWALDFVWDKREVACVLSGMSTMEQLRENLMLAARAQAGRFTDRDTALLEDVRQAFARLRPVPCTGCGYCMPCPNKVDIPENLDLYNQTFAYGLEASRDGYIWLQGQSADQCNGCKRCEEICPQHIRVSEIMPKVHARLTAKTR